MRTLRILAAAAALLLLGACGSTEGDSTGDPITAAELAEQIQKGDPLLVLDVRSNKEFERGHIPGALNIPHDELPARVSEISVAKSEEIVVHCHSGRRAGLATETLHASGFENVRDLTGHWQGWQSAGHPTE